MTASGGGEPYRAQPGSWQQHPHPPVDPQAPVDYPQFPYPAPSANYGYPSPPPYPYPTPAAYSSPHGYGGSPAYPGYYDPYQGYQAYPPQTNNLAVASLVVSIAGIFLGIPMAVFLIGLLIPVLGVVLGIVALNQIKRTHQQGRGLAIAGIVIGSVTAAGMLFVLVILALSTAAMSPSLVNWL